MSTATFDLRDVEREHPADPSGEHAPAGGSFVALTGEQPAPLYASSATDTGSPGLPPSGLLETGSVGLPPSGLLETGPVGLPPSGLLETGSVGLPPSGLLETGTLPRLVDRALAPLQRRRLSAWIAGVPEQVSAIPAQRHRMKLVAFVALWALALAVVIPLVVQGLLSAFELELDLSTTQGTVDAPAPVVEDVLDRS